jgi:signal transduction histidine kinase
VVCNALALLAGAYALATAPLANASRAEFPAWLAPILLVCASHALSRRLWVIAITQAIVALFVVLRVLSFEHGPTMSYLMLLAGAYSVPLLRLAMDVDVMKRPLSRLSVPDRIQYAVLFLLASYPLLPLLLGPVIEAWSQNSNWAIYARVVILVNGVFGAVWSVQMGRHVSTRAERLRLRLMATGALFGCGPMALLTALPEVLTIWTPIPIHITSGFIVITAVFLLWAALPAPMTFRREQWLMRGIGIAAAVFALVSVSVVASPAYESLAGLAEEPAQLVAMCALAVATVWLASRWFARASFFAFESPYTLMIRTVRLVKTPHDSEDALVSRFLADVWRSGEFEYVAVYRESKNTALRLFGSRGERQLPVEITLPDTPQTQPLTASELPGSIGFAIEGMRGLHGALMFGPALGGARPDARDARAIAAIAGELGLAIEAVRAEATAKLQARTLSDARAQAHAATRAARTQFADDLHDGVVQHLLAMRFLAARIRAGHRDQIDPDLARKLADLQTLALEGERQARGLMRAQLQSGGNGGLHASLQELAGLSAAMHGPDAPALVIEDTVSRDQLSPVIDAVSTRIAQEATRNALKHARARRIVVRRSDDLGVITVTVTDDGAGISPVPVEGHGIAAMKRLCEAHSGVITVTRLPEGGTRVTASLQHTIQPTQP